MSYELKVIEIILNSELINHNSRFIVSTLHSPCNLKVEESWLIEFPPISAGLNLQ
jgi:hypothetical protein